jgi:hypothetical protein
MADLFEILLQRFDHWTANLKQTLAGLDAQKLIRIVAIVGAYLLLRPYLIKLAGKSQMGQHEKEEEEAAAAKAKLSPNDLRGKVQIPDDSDDEEGEPVVADWGKKARRRQRKVLKKMLDDHAKKLEEEQEDDEDKDIEEFLTDK